MTQSSVRTPFYLKQKKKRFTVGATNSETLFTIHFGKEPARRGGVRKGKQKKGNGGLSRCEMTLLEHGFKKLNKVPILGALDSTLGTDSGDKSSAPKVYAVLLQLFETYSISVLSRTRSVMSQTPRWRALRWISISVKVCI